MLIDRDLLKKIITWSILIVLSAIVVPVLYFYTDIGLSNSFLVPTVTYLTSAALVFITRCGTFDLFRFQFINWSYSLRKGEPRRYNDYFEYQSAKKEERKMRKFDYYPFLIIGGIELILTIVFAIYII